MHTKFQVTVMVLGVVNNEGDAMHPYIFPQSLRINAEVFHKRRLYIFQQESYMAKTIKEWIYNNLHDHVLLNMVYLTRPESNELSHMGHSWERGQLTPL